MKEPKVSENIFNALVTDVYDGDTITCNIHLGLGIEMTEQKIRLFHINAPEVRGKNKEEGMIVRDFLRNKILNKVITLEIYGQDKYGRYLGSVWLSGENINFLLIYTFETVTFYQP